MPPISEQLMITMMMTMKLMKTIKKKCKFFFCALDVPYCLIDMNCNGNFVFFYFHREDSLTDEARDRSAYAEQPVYPPPQSAYSSNYAAPQSYSQQLYPVAPAYPAPKQYYQAPQPSYVAQQPSYVAQQPAYVAPKPSYVAPQPSYYAPQHYTYPSAPPKSVIY